MECRFQLQPILSKMRELENLLSDSDTGDNSVSHPQLLHHSLLSLQTKVDQIVTHHTSIPYHHHDEFTTRLSNELASTEAESASLSMEINHLNDLYIQATCDLEHNLETLRHSAHFIQSKVQAKTRGHEGNFDKGEDHPNLHDKPYFEIMDLKHKIEKNNVTLNSLVDLDLTLKRFDVVEKVEEALTGLKVIDFEDNCIRVSLTTYIPYFEGMMCQFAENIDKHCEVKHELLIEFMNGTLELKNAEISPNDVYLREIVEAANNFSKLFSMLSVPQTRSSLGWFLQKVQERVVICTTRKLMVKNASGSRHSFVYLDKDELIVAHMTGGIDAFIKPSQGWPLSTSALKLVSLKSSDQNVKEVSLSLLFKVEEVANSLDFDIRKSITKFVDGIEEIVLDKMRAELHLNNILQ